MVGRILALAFLGLFAVFGVYALFERLFAFCCGKKQYVLAVKADGLLPEEVHMLALCAKLSAERNGRFSPCLCALLEEQDEGVVRTLSEMNVGVYVRKQE